MVDTHQTVDVSNARTGRQMVDFVFYTYVVKILKSKKAKIAFFLDKLMITYSKNTLYYILLMLKSLYRCESCCVLMVPQ